MLYGFETLVLDTDRRELRRGEELVRLEPQVFDLLEHLIRHRDRVVSRDDLFETVWRGRIVSDATLSSRISAARAAIGDTGEQQRLIRTLPRKGLRFVGVVSEGEPAGLPAVPSPDGHGEADGAEDHAFDRAGAPDLSQPLALPTRPSIAVLPFQNMSGDPEQDYFADGIVEDITTRLSRIKWLFVIARNSSFTYKGRAVDIRQVGRELGVRYVLEGSVRKAGSRVRITGQLIQAQIGQHIWADIFDGELADVFDLQDRVTASLVAAIEPSLRQAEIERATMKPTDRLDAYDHYLRALPHFYTLTREGLDKALELLGQAIAIDPRFALAKASIGRCYAWRSPQGWALDPAEERETAIRMSREALQSGANDPSIFWMAGFVLWQLRVDPHGALDLYEKALAINANCTQALTLRGWALAVDGRADEALPSLLQALRLSPLDPEAFFTMSALGCAEMIAGRFDEAVQWTTRALRERPGFGPALRFHAASLVELGRLAEARETIEHLLELEPSLSVAALRQRVPIYDPDLLDEFLTRLHRAGLPS